MLISFTLLTAAGVGLRLIISRILAKRFGLRMAVPQLLAGALLVLSFLPSWIAPLPFPLPFSMTLGLLLPDLFFRRA